MDNITPQTSGTKRQSEETPENESQPPSKKFPTPQLASSVAAASSRQLELNTILLTSARIIMVDIDDSSYTSSRRAISCEFKMENNKPVLNLTVNNLTDQKLLYSVSGVITDIQSSTEDRFRLDLILESKTESVILVLNDFSAVKEIQKFFSNEKSGSSIDEKLVLAFSAPFHDPLGVIDNLNAYLDDVTKDWAKNSKFAPFSTVFQSSGFGKTRSMKELAQKRWSAFLCLRDLDKSGIPSRSPLSDLFLYSLNTEKTARKFLYSYVISFIRTINEIKRTEHNHDEIAKNMMKYQPWHYCHGHTSIDDDQNYKIFEHRVQEMYNSLLNVVVDEVYQKDPSWNKYFSQHSITIFIDEAANLLVDSTQKSLTPLHLSKLAKTQSETSSSVDVIRTSDFESKFRVLRRCVQSLFNNIRVMFVLTDTNMELLDFEPPRGNFSASMRKVELVPLNKPYYSLSYIDQLATDYLANFVPGTFSRDWFNNLDPQKTIFLLGRPLWSSLRDARYNDKVRFVTSKLLSVDNWTSLQTSSDKLAAAIAVLSVRTTLAPQLQLSTTNQLIAKHMATLYGINSTRTKFLFRYISEPLLAESSAWMLKQEDNFCKVLASISEFLQSGSSLGSLGAVGEFVSQIILLKAVDNLQEPPQHFTKPHTVQSFLISLVGAANFRRYFYENGKCKIHPKLLEGTICFTHFIKKLNQDLTYCQTLKDFVARAAAGQFKNNNKGFDLFIPVILEDGTITYLLIQIKNTLRNFKEAKDLCHDVQLEWFDTSKNYKTNRRDYLILALNLGKDWFEDLEPIQCDQLSSRPVTRSSTLNQSIRMNPIRRPKPVPKKIVPPPAPPLQSKRTTNNSKRAAATAVTLGQSTASAPKPGQSAATSRTAVEQEQDVLVDEPRFEQNYAFTLNGFNSELYSCFTNDEIDILRLILDCERFEVDSIDLNSDFIRQVMGSSHSL